VEILFGAELKVSPCYCLLLVSHLLHLDKHAPVKGPQLTRVELMEKPEERLLHPLNLSMRRQLCRFLPSHLPRLGSMVFPL